MRLNMRYIVFLFAVSFSAVAAASPFTLTPGDSVVGAVGKAEANAEETLLDLGRREKLGYVELALANPDLDMWLPDDGAAVVLPHQFVLPVAELRGVVLNLPEYRLYVYRRLADGVEVITYPASIGRQDWATPLGQTEVVAKAKDPSWYPPASIRAEHLENGDPLPAVVPPGPDNPLGSHALRLGLPGYLIHGTNKPAGVGMRVTHGCLRLFPEDIAALYAQVSVGTPVHILNQPIKAGWAGDEFWLEVHPSLAQAEGEDERGPGVSELRGVPHALTDLTRAIVRGSGERVADVDWALAEKVLQEADGIPVKIGRLRADPQDERGT